MKKLSGAQKANLVAFSHERPNVYAEGAPHLMHASAMHRLQRLIRRSVEACTEPEINVLDLGAGEGSVTRLWLSYNNTRVTAVDLSADMLAELYAKCEKQAVRLQCVAMDVNEYLANCKERFNIVSCISFLHHVPDYLGLIKLCLPLLSQTGVLITAEDPIRYDTLHTSHQSDFLNNWPMPHGVYAAQM